MKTITRRTAKIAVNVCKYYTYIRAMGFILFLVALLPTVLLTLIWTPISVVYHLVTLKWKNGSKALSKYFYQLAIIIDVFANESLETPLNWLMLNKQPNPFLFGGNDRDTLSYVIAMNKESGTLSRFGNMWARFLNKVDKNHLAKAIENKNR